MNLEPLVVKQPHRMKPDLKKKQPDLTTPPSLQGSLVAVGTHKGYVQIWDAAGGRKLTSLEGHSARVGQSVRGGRSQPSPSCAPWCGGAATQSSTWPGNVNRPSALPASYQAPLRGTVSSCHRGAGIA